jgi:hypothetical protein
VWSGEMITQYTYNEYVEEVRMRKKKGERKKEK